ncbi:hypothetical protein EX30DRAFT_360504 [Ascodesmis nigricans]|uniref:Thioesterase domain-containing protein n=1 Tax=Ascodesmis nigricans TaxID=341454 RepID=A0A4S2N5J8_9PEZI|nr:hypothetical protein EX30DRAFT_360504 [Ascodesmis nigricans]
MSPRLSLTEDDLGPLFSIDHEIPAFDRLCATRDETLSRPCTVSFESRVRRAMTLKSATDDGVIECELVVERDMCSDRKAMHGSCGSCIIDLATCSSLCCLARPGFWAIPAPGYNGTKGWFAGVTRNLAITWVTPLRMGEKLRVRCEIVPADDGQCLGVARLIISGTGHPDPDYG